MRNDVCLRGMIECAIAHIILRSNLISAQQNIIKKEARICVLLFYCYRSGSTSSSSLISSIIPSAKYQALPYNASCPSEHIR